MPQQECVVTVAQLVESLTVTQVVVGSSPISHPNSFFHLFHSFPFHSSHSVLPVLLFAIHLTLVQPPLIGRC